VDTGRRRRAGVRVELASYGVSNVHIAIASTFGKRGEEYAPRVES
jgi:hypothetical protein